MFPIRVKTVQESDLRMLGSLARNIQRVLPVTQADIDAAAALGKGWVVWKVFEVSDPLDNLRGGTQLIIRQNSVQPGQNVRRVIFVSGPGGQTVVIRGSDYIVLPDAIANSLSYVKAFGGTEQRNLPDGYIERQFIYMMDGSYLLTDIVPTYDGHYEMDFQTTSVPSGSMNLFGGRTETYGGLFFVKGASGVCIVDAFGTASDDRYTSSVSLSKNTRYKFTFDNKVATLESGGTTLFTNTFAGENANGRALCINGLNTNGTITTTNTGIYLYSFKAWNGQGELVADYVPAVQKGTVPVVGFYDTVSKTFKTATAGTFAAGGEAVPTPDTPMNIVSNNGVLKARHESGLPLDYTLLDYIETDGNSYIDTGIAVPTTYKWEIKLNSRGTNTSPYWGYSNNNSYSSATSFYSLGANGLAGISGIALSIGVYSGTPESNQQSFYNAVSITDAGTLGGDAPHTIRCEGDFVFTADGTAMTQVTPKTFSDFTPTGTAYLFARHAPSISKSGNGARIYLYKVWNENNVLVQNFVPAKNSSNVVGMYDTVSGRFFTNAGSGNFTAGAPVSDPVEIYTDGTVETIWAHGKNLFDPNTTVPHKYINSSGYEMNSYSTTAWLNHTDYIKVKGGESYTLSVTNADGGTNTVAFNWFDTNKTILSTRPTKTVNTSSYTFTATAPANAEYLIVNYIDGSNKQIEQGSTATSYQPYFDGGTATAKMLLKVGNYQDVQEILAGDVTRKVGVKVLDGTESWETTAQSTVYRWLTPVPFSLPNIGICSHYVGVTSNKPIAEMPDMSAKTGSSNASYLYIKDSSFSNNLSGFKQWLADQYAAGTPVTIIYPLATETTESVAGQTLQVQDGDNVLEITQASLDGLELEVEYQAAVSLTIQEVQDANLDNNVEVTIQ